jgi:predicted outer membrane repeat protein
MKFYSTLFFFLVLSFSILAQTDVSGEQSGIWTASGSPYNVTDSIVVPAGDTLFIEAGVTVNLQGHYKILVYGVIQAFGTANDSIIFTASNSTEGWAGISLGNSINSTITAASGISNFEYCKFEYGKTLTSDEYPDMNGGVVRMLNSNATFTNCVFTNNDASPSEGMGGAIYAINTGSTSEALTKFTDCLFENNKAYSEGGAIKFSSDYNTEIVGCQFINNTTGYGGGAINFYSVVDTKMIQCLFANNSTTYDNGGALKALGSDNSLYFKNCTIVKNTANGGSGGALALYYGQADFVNCIVYGNTSQYDDDNVYVDAGSGSATVNYCNITMPEYNTTGSNNIETDPLFVDYDNGDYHLQANSPCVDAGTDIGLPYYGDAPDMGCFEYQDSVPDTTQIISLTNQIQIYPNPTKGIVKISQITDIQYITIVDIAGKEVFRTNAKTNILDISELQNGIYFLTIFTNTKKFTSKIILEK